MAGEGEFPKADGDVLHASEVNEFNNAGLYAVGSSITINSGTAYQPIGSVVIAPGSLTNPCYFEIHSNSNGGNCDLKTWISGTSSSNYSINGVQSNTNAFQSVTRYIAGSPLSSNIWSEDMQLSDDNISRDVHAGNIFYISDAPFNHLDTGSVVVVKFELRANANFKKLNSYAIRIGRITE